MITLSSDSLKGYGLNRIFKIVKDAGFDGLDLFVDPRDFDTQDADYVKELIDQYDLPVLAIQAAPTGNARTIIYALEIAKKI